MSFDHDAPTGGARHGGPLEGAPAVLVANRGEIAVRIIATLRRLGLRSVAVYGDGDPDARHVRAADTAVRIGGADLADSYLDGAAIIAAALETGARLVHPGYGFLSENAGFARACADAGLVFVGPPPEAIEAMGDKIAAKATVAAAGVPLLPGFAEEAGRPMADTDLLKAAEAAGYPLLLKPSAGGGGKGMRLVRSAAELPGAAAAARREASAAFGDPTLLAERYVERPRHIEIQVLADAHGTVVHLGERECSLQRRHQKIVEEAPSPLLSDAQRSAMGEAAVAAAKACGYVGAGTVEFIVATPDGAEADAGTPAGAPEGGPPSFSQTHSTPAAPAPSRGLWTEGRPESPAGPHYAFLEMNTRLQVEHPVTEEVTTVRGRRGVDLVELQLRVALGEPLPFAQHDLGVEGHAVEARVYAEDPARDFLPTGGRVLALHEPQGPGVRVDSGLGAGDAVTSAYDPMLAKVIAWGPDRAEALRRTGTALGGFVLLGCATNTAFLRRLLAHPDVAEGRLDTGLTERLRPLLTAPAPDTSLPGGVPAEVYAAVAVDRHLDLEPADPVGADRFTVPDGWRIGAPAWTAWRLRAARDAAVTVRVRRERAPERPGGAVGYLARVGDAPPVTVRARRTADATGLEATVAGRARAYRRAADGDDRWLGDTDGIWHLTDEPAFRTARAAESGGDGTVRSPMPGTVLAVPVAEGDTVAAGDPVAVVEAMKMEHTVTAPFAGTVTSVPVRPGAGVAMDAPLAVVEPAAPAPGPEDPADTPTGSQEEHA